MKRFFLSVVLATTLALTSCQFDDSALWSKLDEYGQSIKDHEQRISALEELCKQMNTNIEALQTLVDALEKRDYVTNVSEVRSNGEVIGYTISFAYSDTITIYHGKDGKDGANGADGKDGYTPQIGVMKDTDNIYYWTLDGEWLLDAKGNKIKAVGTDGKDGQDGANGTDGKDGQNGTNGSDGKDGQNGTNGTDGKDGADGKDGITPQLKIENDYWYVSYDNGATWVQLGKATGEDGQNGANGADGENGKDGDSIFNSVTQDDEYVYFNLADGTMITLPKHDKENIQFEDLQVKAICCKNWDTNNDGELSYAEAAAVETIGTIFKGNTNIIAFTELKYFTGITEIPVSAFNGCSILWKVALPENVKSIGSNAFYNCTGLHNIIIPNNVEGIGDSAFYQCTNLAGVTLSDNLVDINQRAFYACDKIKSISIPNSVIKICQGAFYGCSSIQKVLFESGSSLQIIDGVANEGAFQNCSSLQSITIPKKVVSIGVSAFQNCSALETLNFETNSTLEIIDGSIDLNASDRVVTTGGAFRNCTSLKSVVIPASVHTIGASAFKNCTALNTVAFEENSKLNYLKGTIQMTYSDGDTGWGCFSNCTMLKSIVIPKGIKQIDIGAFYNSGLEEVYIQAVVPPTLTNKTNAWDRKRYGYEQFSKCYIYVPLAYLDYYKTASGWASIASRTYPIEVEE